MADKEKIYGVADKAWQIVVGCDPRMPCAPRCWARKTVARIVECQKAHHPDRAEFFQIALTADGKKWSGEVRLDERHLPDPLRWRKPALIATGFHGDIGRLGTDEVTKILRVACGALSKGHRFLFLTKCPGELGKQLAFAMNRIYGFHWRPAGISIGCSVMTQADADEMRGPMTEIAVAGWATHVWHEPAIGPADWRGWEFLRGMITGFESGAKARPGHPRWARADRDWCIDNRVPFFYKQWGEWGMTAEHGFGGREHLRTHTFSYGDGTGVEMIRIGKKSAGRMLDGRTWDELPEVR